MKTLKQLQLENKRVFLRVDFNVPIHKGKILSDLRIRQALKTINYILRQKPKQLIIGSHLGRPQGWDTSLSLAPVAKELSKQLKKRVYLHANILAPIETRTKIVLLENLRFWSDEQKGTQSFAESLAQHADVYINDAFGTAHRKDVSVYALAKEFKQKAPGFLIEHELEEVHLNHKKPMVALFGPAKIADKLPLLKQLVTKMDKVMLGGGVVFTFLKAMNVEIGKSLVEESMLKEAKQLLTKYSHKLVFPVDFQAASPASLHLTCAQRMKQTSIVSFDAIPKSKACYDIGPRSVKLFSAILKQSKTVIWNGPLGLFEYRPFNKSTTALAKVIAEEKLVAIVCGGDTAAALRKTAYKQNMTHISTGGGASLQLLAGKKLPALDVL